MEGSQRGNIFSVLLLFLKNRHNIVRSNQIHQGKEIIVLLLKMFLLQAAHIYISRELMENPVYSHFITVHIKERTESLFPAHRRVRTTYSGLLVHLSLWPLSFSPHFICAEYSPLYLRTLCWQVSPHSLLVWRFSFPPCWGRVIDLGRYTLGVMMTCTVNSMTPYRRRWMLMLKT